MFIGQSRRAMLAMAIAWIGGLPGRCAFGASPPCATVRIDEPSDLSPAWADAVREARRSLAHAAEVGCDGVTVFVSGVSTDHAGEESVRISAMAVDGRRAERLVRKPSALPPTIYGLLASVPDDEPRSLVRDSAIPANQVVYRCSHRQPRAPGPHFLKFGQVWPLADASLNPT